MRLPRWSLPVLLLLVVGAGAPQAQDALRADAASMEEKLAAIVTRAELPAAANPSVQRTSFSDQEVNAYFRVRGPEFLPEGVVDPQLTIGDAGRVQARVTVDLDLALKPRERSWLDPLAYVGGKVDVVGLGTVHATNGRGVLQLESTTLGGVEIPKALLQELVTFFTSSEDHPRGFQLEEPFELPSAIRAVETAPGRATVVQ